MTDVIYWGGSPIQWDNPAYGHVMVESDFKGEGSFARWVLVPYLKDGWFDEGAGI